MTWLLAPGLRLARRDADHVQLGVDPPRVVVMSDTPGVRRLVAELAAGTPLTTPRDEVARVLEQLVVAGLVVPAAEEAARRTHHARARVLVDAPPTVAGLAGQLLAEAGLATTTAPDEASVALLWGEGEVRRTRVDAWMRTDLPHLVATDHGAALTVGPYVVPGLTACLRCLDAHATEADPRRGLVVEQVATAPALREGSSEPALRMLALSWAVHDLVEAAEGREPSTWSATVRLDARLPPDVRRWRRHVHCGCTWAEDLRRAS